MQYNSTPNRARFAAIVLLAALTLPSSAAELIGRVVSVSDGDTITVLDASKVQHRVRLTGIDAPESKQAFGSRSRESLADLVAGKQVQVQWEKRDRFDRVLGQVTTKDGTDANLAQIERGMAWHFTRFSNTRPIQESRSYAAAQRSAQEQRIGLWRDKSPIAPWDWRTANR